MKSMIDADACTGCGVCVQTCPEVFKMDNDKALVYMDPIPSGLEDKTKQVASDCPVEAIKIEE